MEAVHVRHVMQAVIHVLGQVIVIVMNALQDIRGMERNVSLVMRIVVFVMERKLISALFARQGIICSRITHACPAVTPPL